MSPRFRFGSGAGLASSTPIWWTLAGSCATLPLLIAASSSRVLAGACSTSVAHTDVTSPPRLRLTLCEHLSTLGRFAPSPAGQPANLSAGCGVHPAGENGHVQEDRLGPATHDVSPHEIGDLRPIVTARIDLPG